MRTLTLFDGLSVVSVLEIPDHATDSQAACIVAAGLSLAHARGWDANYTAPTGARDVFGAARTLAGVGHV